MFRIFTKYLCLLAVLIGIWSSYSTPVNNGVPTNHRAYCHAKWFNNSSSFVCVCDSKHCDNLRVNKRCGTTMACAITTSAQKDRFRVEKIRVHKSKQTGRKADLSISINVSLTFQSILGFGGALTDAAGINVFSLPRPAQKKLMNSYYSPQGLEYTLGRIPMGSCDFSTHVYSYDDHRDDFNLSYFALKYADLAYKIPLFQMASAISRSDLKVFGSPWSSPGWMKNTSKMEGPGVLIGQPDGKYYKTWAKYFVKFIQAYQVRGVPIWGVTVQNEPEFGLNATYAFQALGFTAEMERDFIKHDLGPALKEAGLGHVKLMIFDDNRHYIYNFSHTVQVNADLQVLNDSQANDFVSGVAVHWYADAWAPTDQIDQMHAEHPDKFILMSEACHEGPPVLGSWDHAELYALDIIQNLNHWYTGWVDWNIALDLHGGPNWVENFVDSPIIVNSQQGEFYRQPMFYIIAHFSKFLKPRSPRISHTITNPNNATVDATTWLTPTKTIVIILLNRSEKDVLVEVKHGEKIIQLLLDPMSVKTLLIPP